MPRGGGLPDPPTQRLPGKNRSRLCDGVWRVVNESQQSALLQTGPSRHCRITLHFNQTESAFGHGKNMMQCHVSVTSNRWMLIRVEQSMRGCMRATLRSVLWLCYHVRLVSLWFGPNLKQAPCYFFLDDSSQVSCFPLRDKEKGHSIIDNW